MPHRGSHHAQMCLATTIFVTRVPNLGCASSCAVWRAVLSPCLSHSRALSPGSRFLAAMPKFSGTFSCRNLTAAKHTFIERAVSAEGSVYRTHASSQSTCGHTGGNDASFCKATDAVKKEMRHHAHVDLGFVGAALLTQASSDNESIGARRALLSVCAVAFCSLVCLCVVPLGVHVCISQHVQALRAFAPDLCKGFGVSPAAAINVLVTQRVCPLIGTRRGRLVYGVGATHHAAA